MPGEKEFDFTQKKVAQMDRALWDMDDHGGDGRAGSETPYREPESSGLIELLGLLFVALIVILFLALNGFLGSGGSGSDACPAAGKTHAASYGVHGPVLGRSARFAVPASKRASACVNTLTGNGSGPSHYQHVTPVAGPSGTGTGSTDGFDAAANGLPAGDGGGGSGNVGNPELRSTPASPHTNGPVDVTPQQPAPPPQPAPQQPEDPCTADPTSPGCPGAPEPPPDVIPPDTSMPCTTAAATSDGGHGTDVHATSGCM